jgi:hypothetical protein
VSYKNSRIFSNFSNILSVGIEKHIHIQTPDTTVKLHYPSCQSKHPPINFKPTQEWA